MNKALSERAYHHGNLREALLEQAVSALELMPAEQLSLRAIARSLGVSQTAPYRHFNGKEALFAAIATRGYRTLLASLEAARRTAGPDAIAQLHAVARAYVDFAAQQKQLFKLMFGPLVQPSETYPELREVSRETLSLVQSIMRDGVEQGVIQDGDLINLSNSAWGGIHGLATLTIDAPELFRRHIDLMRQIDLSLEIFIRGVRPVGV
ncbi:MAG: TetR/AcrR family transcriptional regulator [Pseudomonadota bacterium]